MEHESDPNPDRSEGEPEMPRGSDAAGCARIAIKIVAGLIVVFIVAVGLVFGVCLLG
jgi:hypothetical protein